MSSSPMDYVGPVDAPALTEDQMLTLLTVIGPPGELCGSTDVQDYVRRFDRFFAASIGNGHPSSWRQWKQWYRWCVDRGLTRDDEL
jgi:hypothetical protein